MNPLEAIILARDFLDACYVLDRYADIGPAYLFQYYDKADPERVPYDAIVYVVKENGHVGIRAPENGSITLQLEWRKADTIEVPFELRYARD